MRVRRSRFLGLAPRLREPEFGKAGIALSLAVLTVLATVVAGLQAHASIEAQRGERESDRIAIEATGRDASSVVQVGAAYGVYRRWFEQLERASWASSQLTAEPNGGDAPLLRTLERIEKELQEWTAKKSDLLQEPYYDPKVRVSDFARYEADRLVAPETRAAEERDIQAAAAGAWDAKASDYVSVLTIVAVGLFFLGLASTLAATARAALAGAGLLFGAVALGWTVLLAATPVHRVPPDAVEHVVEARVALSRIGQARGPGELAADARDGFARAIASADAAVRTDAGYLSAYLARATAQTSYADALIFSKSGPGREAGELLSGALDDYRRYLAGHADDYSAWWSLGWASYLAGDARGSIAATDEALRLSPDQFALHLNRGLARLATGDGDGALHDVERGLSLAREERTGSASWLLGQSDFEIGRLAEQRPHEAETLRVIQRRLREAQVAFALERPAAPMVGAPGLGKVETRVIDRGRYQPGRFVEHEPLVPDARVEAQDGVGLRLRTDGAPIRGRQLSARLWIDGFARPEYDRHITVDGSGTLTLDLLSPYGRAGFDLDPGSYALELYVDGATRHQLTWTVVPRSTEPDLATTASVLLARLAADGFSCERPDPPTAGEGTTCRLDRQGASYQVYLTFDARDRITYVNLDATASEAGTVESDARDFFGYVVRLVYRPATAERVEAWVREQGTAVDDLEIAGTTVRVHGATETHRALDIWAPWP